MNMKKEEKFVSQNWLKFKEFEKSLIVNLLKAQDFIVIWRNYLLSAEFWNISWLWTSLLMKICSLRIRFAVGQGAKRKLISWVSSHVPKKYLAKGFPDSFKDGILLCALTEKLVSGACPRFDLLDPEQPLRNLNLAFHLVEKHIKIKLPVTAEEVFEGGKFSEKRLLLLVAQMKLASEKFNLSPPALQCKKDYMSQTTFVSEKCFARGMGLLLAVRGRKACFTILLDTTDNLDMVVEIRGPNGTVCNKRITGSYCLSRNDSSEFRDIVDFQVKESILKKKIPLTYKIMGRKILVGYTPLESGTHHMSIIWQGQHIMGSPYTITVDNSIETSDTCFSPSNRCYGSLKRTDSRYYDESFDYSNEKNLTTCVESSGSVVRKRILQYIVKIDGNEVVIDGKEDLCAAINNYKQRNNTSVNVDGNETHGYEYLRLCSKDEFKARNSYTENVNHFPSNEMSTLKNVDDKAIKENEFITSKNKGNTKDMLGNKNILLEDPGERSETSNFISQVNHFERIDNKPIIINNDGNLNCINGINKHDVNFQEQTKAFNALTDAKVSGCGDKIQTLDYVNDSEGTNNCNLDENVTKSDLSGISLCEFDNKVSILEEDEGHQFRTKILANEFEEHNSNFDLNTEFPRRTSNDDINLFPVHKVEYESLLDDDSDFQLEFNTKRRKSFTELNEMNYLDEYSNDRNPSAIKPYANLNSDVNEIETECSADKDVHADESQKFKKESASYDSNDRKSSVCALFECDHSLAFWSETVDETVPESVTDDACEFDNFSEQNISEIQEGKLMELESSVSDDVILGKLDDLSDENTNIERIEKCLHLNDFSELNASLSVDNSISQYKNQNMGQENQIDTQRRGISQVSSENRKRSSWSDIDVLPSIRESSTEFLDLETIYTNTLDVDPSDSKIKNIVDINIEDKCKETCSKSLEVNDSLVKDDKAHKGTFDYLKNNVFQPDSLQVQNQKLVASNLESGANKIMQQSAADSQLLKDGFENKNTLLSMAILSTTPYKRRNAETKNGTSVVLGAKLENSPKQPSASTQSAVLSESENIPKDCIFTYASPVVIDDGQNHINAADVSCLNSEDTRNVTLQTVHKQEQKPAQCLSVKNVIQIFQTEKKEPIDMWPMEGQNSKVSFKKQNEIFQTGRNNDEDLLSIENSSNFGINSFSFEKRSRLMPRSSIMDRVKLFEQNEHRENATEKRNALEKRSHTKVSEKKHYWENVIS